MSTPTVTAKGQVTLGKKVLEHLGVKPGNQVEIDRLPNGRIEVKAGRPKRNIAQLFGLLAQKNGPHFTIEELNEIIADAWAGKR